MKYCREDAKYAEYDIAHYPSADGLRDRIIEFIGINKIYSVEHDFIECTYREFKELWYSGHLREEQDGDRHEPVWKMMTPLGLIEIQFKHVNRDCASK